MRPGVSPPRPHPHPPAPATELLVWKMESLHPAVPGFHTCEELLRCSCWTLHTPGLLCLLVSFPGPVSFAYLKRFEVILPWIFSSSSPTATLSSKCAMPYSTLGFSQWTLNVKAKQAGHATSWMTFPHSTFFCDQGSSPYFQPFRPWLTAMCIPPRSLNFNVHVKHLGVLLKWRFSFYKSVVWPEIWYF